MLEFLNELSNNNFLTTLFGAVVGGLISILTSLLVYHLQKRDDQHKERVRRYELCGEFAVEHHFQPGQEHVLAKMEVFLGTYKIVKAGDYVDFLINKGKEAKRGCSHRTFYLRNVGQSTVNQLDLCVSSPKHLIILPYQNLSYYVNEHLANFSILCDERIAPRGLLQIDIHYDEDDAILDVFSSTLKLVYMDSLHEVYAQPFFPENDKIYEPHAISWEEYNHTTRSQLVEERVAQDFLQRLSFKQRKDAKR